MEAVPRVRVPEGRGNGWAASERLAALSRCGSGAQNVHGWAAWVPASWPGRVIVVRVGGPARRVCREGWGGCDGVGSAGLRAGGARARRGARVLSRDAAPGLRGAVRDGRGGDGPNRGGAGRDPRVGGPAGRVPLRDRALRPLGRAGALPAFHADPPRAPAAARGGGPVSGGPDRAAGPQAARPGRVPGRRGP